MGLTMVIPSQKVLAFINAALECSVFVAPRESGLTYEELLQVGKSAGFQEGEIGDALSRANTRQFFGGRRLEPNLELSHLNIFIWPEDPEFRDLAAFDFVYNEFNKLIKSQGGGKAKLERDVLVERAIEGSIDRHGVEVAITILLMTGQLEEKNKLLFRPNGGIYEPLPSEQNRNAKGTMRRPERERAYPIVKDVIERRVDGRVKNIEPLDAFAHALDALGYGKFRLWWKQTVGELNRSDAASMSISICVLSAALVEGALTFVVKHAQSLKLGVFQSKTFDGQPRTWKIDDLVQSAARGGESAILSANLKVRAESLILLR